MMNPDWNNLSSAISEFSNLFEGFTEGVSDQRTIKACKMLTLQWNKVINFHNEYDAKLEPISPLEIKYPFQGSDFAETWKDYKDFLLESHNFTMKSRSEKYALSRLKKLSDNNVSRAMEMLGYFMSTNAKSIFNPSPRQLTGDELPKEETISAIDYTTQPKLNL